MLSLFRIFLIIYSFLNTCVFVSAFANGFLSFFSDVAPVPLREQSSSGARVMNLTCTPCSAFAPMSNLSVAYVCFLGLIMIILTFWCSAFRIFPYDYSSIPFAILSVPGSIWFEKMMKYEQISLLIFMSDSSRPIS